MVKSTEAPIINAYIIQKSIVFPTTSLGGFSISTYMRERRNTEDKKRLLLTRGKIRILEKQRQKRRKRAFKALSRENYFIKI